MKEKVQKKMMRMETVLMMMSMEMKSRALRN